MENKKKIYLIAAITLILALAFVGVMIKMILENSKCVDDPFGYSAMRLKESGGEYLCGCQGMGNFLDFSFNEDGIKIIPQEQYKEINPEDIVFIP